MTSEFILKDSNDLKKSTYLNTKEKKEKKKNTRDPRSCSLLLVFFFICLFVYFLILDSERYLRSKVIP